MLHETIRQMIEKGQPIPTELLQSQESPGRPKSDLRRGLVFIEIGLGAIILLFMQKQNAWPAGLIWKKIGSFRSEGKFSTWFFSIAHNEWRMRVRGRKEVAFEELADQPPEAELPDGASASHLRLDLAEAMKTLTPAERAMIVLCSEWFVARASISGAGLSLGTVKTKVLRGKKNYDASWPYEKRNALSAGE